MNISEQNDLKEYIKLKNVYKLYCYKTDMNLFTIDLSLNDDWRIYWTTYVFIKIIIYQSSVSIVKTQIEQKRHTNIIN